jgi:hypothetical protein
MLPQEDGAQFLIALQLWWRARMTRRRRAGYAPKGCFGIPLNIEKKNLQGNKNNSFVLLPDIYIKCLKTRFKLYF